MVVRIHPGQSSHPPCPLVPAFVLLLALFSGVTPVAAQERTGAERVDSAEVHDDAAQAQARFERLRRRYSPGAPGSWGGRCDEIVGRICLRLEATGDWWPEPAAPRIREARSVLLAHLDSAAALIPGDAWILGQQAVYLAEAGRASEALGRVRACRPATPAWCRALEGYLLHVLQQFAAAELAFQGALEEMPPEERRRWTDPGVLADRKGRELLDQDAPEVRDRLVRRFWAFADPLALVEGNDRWTEHLARWVVARTREDATNPYNLRWGDDLEEVLVRYGWEVGWEQIPPRPSEITPRSHAVGHQHPESRSYVPPGASLTEVAGTEPEDWNPGSRYLARTGYAPPYAPVILPADAEVHRVPRGDSLVLVAAVSLPPDTSYHRRHDHEPLTVPPRFRDGGAAIGLFALDGEGIVAEDRATGARGVLRIAVPPGAFVLSAEVWDADSLRAGRHRQGIEWTALPPDLPTASDLFLLEPGEAEVTRLDHVVDRLLVGGVVTGRTAQVAWELYGFGWRSEVLSYRLEVREAPGGFLRRAGRFLGLFGDEEVTTLEWTEPGPGEPGPALRSAGVSLPPEMGPGDYRIRLEVRAPGREPLVMERMFRYEPGSR